MQGIDPRTSHMLSERSTIWATSPVTQNSNIYIYKKLKEGWVGDKTKQWHLNGTILGKLWLQLPYIFPIYGQNIILK